MAELITTGLASQAGHWYKADGSPAYEVEKKGGGLRPATLRDARKLGLYPSVTTILNVAAKPGLERWKIEQAMLAALTLPRLPEEDDTAFIRRAATDAQEQARKAAEAGTALHAAIEASLHGLAVAPEHEPACVAVRDWIYREFGSDAGWAVERSFACPQGYGGKVDLYSKSVPCVIDFKTKEFDAESPPAAYEEQGMQLAAYGWGLGIGEQFGECRRINVFVSRTVPGLIHPVEHPRDTWDAHLEMFLALLDYWRAKTGHKPEEVGYDAALP